MRVLIIEDNIRLGSLMATLLREHGHSVDVTGTIEDANTALKMAKFDVLILDLSLPDGDGREFLSSIRQGGDHAMIIVVTARGDVVDRVQVLNSGADDYLVKPFSDDELVARVRALGRRQRPLRDNVLTAGNVRLDTESMTLTVSGRSVAAPRREMSVLSALMAQNGRILSRERLENSVYSFDNAVTDNAIEAAISRLRKRLDEAGATIKITAMRGLGYILTESTSC